MTSAEMKACLQSLGMRQRELALRLGMTESAISRYVRGERSRYTGEAIPVPPYVRAYLDLAKKLHEAAIPY